MENIINKYNYQSLQVDFCRPWEQNTDPPHVLQCCNSWERYWAQFSPILSIYLYGTVFRLPCSHTPLPPHGWHLYFSLPCLHIVLPLSTVFGSPGCWHSLQIPESCPCGQAEVRTSSSPPSVPENIVLETIKIKLLDNRLMINAKLFTWIRTSFFRIIWVLRLIDLLEITALEFL